MIHGQCNLYVYSGNAPAEEGAKSENRTNLFFFRNVEAERVELIQDGIWERGKAMSEKMGLKMQCPHSIS